MPVVQLLGTPAIFLDEKQVKTSRVKTSALLYYLAYQSDWVSRDDLVYLFWPDTDENKARANLRQLLRSLKKLPYLEQLQITPKQICWRVATDVLELQQCLEQQETSRLVELYQGHLLENFRADSIPEFSSWLAIERQSLFAKFHDTVSKCAIEFEANGRYDKAIQLLEHLHSLEPYDEAIFRRYLKILGQSGNAAQAQQVFKVFQTKLQLELSLEPDPATLDLLQHLQSMTNQGSLRNPKKGPLALPVPATPFIGREIDLAIASQKLSDPGCRLLTLVAPGGMGKTRLAIELGKKLAPSFADGTYFIALESVPLADLIAPVIAETLDLPLSGQKSPKQEVCDYLANKELLLILDNLEHLTYDLKLIPELLALAPNLKLLCTSREILNLQAEWLYDLQGLKVPEDDLDLEVTEVDAVKLFLQRAEKFNGSFAPTERALISAANICRKLGGMPLALELAASWLRLLSLEDIEQELNDSMALLKTSVSDMPKRHLDITSVFEASWSRLNSHEQASLRKLSVFESGFTREAAWEVTRTGLPLLLLLINKSFIRMDASKRFNAHPLIWHFLRQKAKEHKEEQLVAKEMHAIYFLNFAEDRKGFHERSNVQEIRTELNLELANIRHAWEFATAFLREDLLALGNLTLFQHFLMQARYEEGADFFKQASESLKSNSLTHARVLHNHATLLSFSGEPGIAKPLLEHSLALIRKHNATWAIGQTLLGLALTYSKLDYLTNQEQAKLFREAASYFHAADDEMLQGRAQIHQAEYSISAHERESLFKEALEMLRKQSGYHELIHALLSYANHLLFTHGDFKQASIFAEEGVTIERKRGVVFNLAIRLTDLGTIYRYGGAYEKAHNCFLEVLSLGNQVATSRLSYAHQQLAVISLLAGNLEDAKRQLDEAVIMKNGENTMFLALSYNVAGLLAMKQGDGRNARENSENAYHYFSSIKGLKLENAWHKELVVANYADSLLVNHSLVDAKKYLHEALVLTLEWGFQTALLHLLPSFAKLRLLQQNPEEARSLVSICLNNPAAMAETREKAKVLFLTLPEALQEVNTTPLSLDQVAQSLLI